jgi:FKBP-type peptidyl-prolyl cis-trans isomerase FklB
MKLKLLAAVIGLGLLGTQVYADTDASMGNGSSASTDASQLKGNAFLKENKSKPGVITLADGLQYKVIKAGHGTKPTDQDMVTVDYSGKLIDGTEFDSSSKHGGPAQFQVGQVIPGWVEALKLMPVGSTWELYIPSDLAYGSQGAPPSIGPNETLIFKVTLISAKKG